PPQPAPRRAPSRAPARSARSPILPAPPAKACQLHQSPPRRPRARSPSRVSAGPHPPRTPTRPRPRPRVRPRSPRPSPAPPPPPRRDLRRIPGEPRVLRRVARPGLSRHREAELARARAGAVVDDAPEEARHDVRLGLVEDASRRRRRLELDLAPVLADDLRHD